MILDRRFNKSELNPAIRRYIKRKEEELGRTCRMIWCGTNPEGETYLYANFCKNWDRLTVTIGFHRPSTCGGFVAPLGA